MNPKRKKVQDKILNIIKIMDPSNKNTKIYEEKFSKMDDKAFHEFMIRIRDRTEVLPIYAANGVDHIAINNLVKAAKTIKLELFERIRMYDQVNDIYYFTPHKLLVLKLPIRRTVQFIDHKLSVPEGDSRIDMLSGQVVKPDQAAAISEPETRVLYSHGLKSTLKELIKYRGGDVMAFAEYKRELEETGKTTVERDTGTKVRSAVTIDVLYSGMLIESNAAGV